MTSSHPAPHKPAELFRADLISAMKLPDSMPLEPGSFLTIKEPWRTEWEIGVQVCVSPDHILEASTRTIADPPTPVEEYECSQKYIHEDEENSDYVMYDLDELDLNWLESVNSKRKFRALASPKGLEEDTLREALLTLETKCQQSMARAVATEETLGIEYDEQTTCDVCRDYESEDNNDMIFCDSCNLCVHQACYGVATIPRGEWLCRVCLAGDEQARCVLCTVKGGALKRVRPGNTSWAHLCCALWIPEVRVGNADRMEPITNVDGIPPSRRNLVCCICRRRLGACIQCSHPLCVTAYHVTCGFQHGLDMKTRLDMVTNAVIHESYCPKHTAMRKSPTKHSYHSSNKNHTNRPSQLVQLQESFYNYASPENLVTKLNLSLKLSTLIYNYWKLKRKFQHNRPLLSHLPIETSLESIKAELAAGGIKYGMDVDESFLKIVHLRQNLEKARNLVYMVQRRERLKKQLLQIHSERLKLETILETENLASNIQTLSLPTSYVCTDEERSTSDVDVESSSDVDTPSLRQTRSMTQGVVVSCSTPAFSSLVPASFTTTTPQNNLHKNHFPPSPILLKSTMLNGPSSPTNHSRQPNVLRDSTIKTPNVTNDCQGETEFLSRNLRRRELRVGTKADWSHCRATPSLIFDGSPQRVTKINSIGSKSCRNNGGLSVKGNDGIKPIVLNGNLRKTDTLSEPSNVSLNSSGMNHRDDSNTSHSASLLSSKEDSHVLRNRLSPGLRMRPYSINHNSSSRKSS